MTAATLRTPTARRPRRPPGRVADRRGRAGEPAAPDGHRPLVLRCPGPLVALRGLAALFDVPAERLAACLQAHDARATEGTAGALRGAISHALGCAPLSPTHVHYFHAVRLQDPPSVLAHGLRPRGWLVCDRLLRPALYGCDDDLDLDLAERVSQPTTPCIVEYRRPAAADGQDVDAALAFVEAALRGTVSASAAGGHDPAGTPIGAHDIVCVRAIATQTEWTAAHQPR